MTRKSTFKNKVRARMATTGERYAAARAALLGQRHERPEPPRAGLLPGYRAAPGLSGDLARLCSALHHAGVIDPATGAPFTEARVFGLSGGPGFMYFLFEYAGHPPMLTITCRSFSLPAPLVERVVAHAGVDASTSQTGSSPAASKALRQALDRGCVAHCTVDRASLPWLGQDPVWVGQWPQQVNVVGEHAGRPLIDDGALHELEHEALSAARAAVRKEKNRLVTFAGGVARVDPAEATRRACAVTARSYHEAPYAGFASNFGLRGLQKWAEMLRGDRDKKAWGRAFASGPLSFRALLRTWECVTVELTAPAGGRHLYASFLDEAAGLPGLSSLREAAALARASGERFEALAERAVEAGGSALERAVDLTERMAEAAAAEADGATVRALRAERDGLAAELSLDAGARREVFSALATHVDAIVVAETELARVLASVGIR